MVAAPLQTVLAFNALATGLYVLAFIYGIYLVQRSLAQPGMIRVGDALARALAHALEIEQRFQVFQELTRLE